MSYEDLIEDKIADLKYKIMSSTSTNEAKRDYEKYKHLTQEKIKRYWESLKENFYNYEECYCYDILDRVVDLNNEHAFVLSSELAIFMKLDESFKEYCIGVVEDDGIIAVLKHKKQIHFHKNLIKEALSLC